MGVVKKIIILSVIIIAVAFIIVNTDAWSLLGKPIDLSMTENAVVQKVSFDRADNNTILLDVQSMCSKTIILTTAVIKNSEQVTVATIVSFQKELPANTNTIISIDLSGIQLSPGNYTINLWTTKSHVLTSPSFALPAK